MKQHPLLWVEVSNKNVRFCGGDMPKELGRDPYFYYTRSSSMDRKEFERWSGLRLPKDGGVFGCRITLAVVEKYRVVEEKSYIATEKLKSRLERLP